MQDPEVRACKCPSSSPTHSANTQVLVLLSFGLCWRDQATVHCTGHLHPPLVFAPPPMRAIAPVNKPTGKERCFEFGRKLLPLGGNQLL